MKISEEELREYLLSMISLTEKIISENMAESKSYKFTMGERYAYMHIIKIITEGFEADND